MSRGKDTKPRVRRTKEELAKGLTLEDARSLRQTVTSNDASVTVQDTTVPTSDDNTVQNPSDHQ